MAPRDAARAAWAAVTLALPWPLGSETVGGWAGTSVVLQVFLGRYLERFNPYAGCFQGVSVTALFALVLEYLHVFAGGVPSRAARVEYAIPALLLVRNNPDGDISARKSATGVLLV